jgi:hypothetical protein
MFEILSTTHGVDFGPYFKNVAKTVQQNWNALIPPNAETKQCELAIAFTVKRGWKSGRDEVGGFFRRRRIKSGGMGWHHCL